MITEIITTITTAITEFGTSAVAAISDNFNRLVMDGTITDGVWVSNGELSNVAVWGLCFMGISLVIGLGRLVFNLVRNRG